MRRRIIHTIFLLIGTGWALIAFSSCRKEPSFGLHDDDGSLRARRATEPGKNQPTIYFEEGTLYRLWAYDPTAGGVYMFDPEVSPRSNGIPAKESVGNYIKIEQHNAKLLRNAFDVYGFTDGRKEDDPDENVLAADPESDYDNPTYTISYNPALKEEGGYPDYYRACLHYNAAAQQTSPVMEFEHVLSRIRVQVIQQGVLSEETAEETYEGVYDLHLHSVSLVGVRDEAIYHVREHTFRLPENAPAEGGERLLREVDSGMEVIPFNAIETPFSESYVLPTIGPDTNKVLKLKLVIGGDDAYRFKKEGTAPDEEGNYIVEVDLYSRSGGEEKPLRFKSNGSYMLRVIFSRDGVIMFTPLLYPWFEGEVHDGNPFEEQPLGNTFLFDNLIWADRNLGAEDFDPRDKESFQNCTGFFYQFNRNIPYLPMKSVNGKLVKAVEEGMPVYPVISFPLDPAKHGPRNVSNDDATYDNYVHELEKIDYEKIASGEQYINYNSKDDAFTKDGYPYSPSLWDDIMTQPSTPGWRLPTQQEFLGIFPSTPYAGNLTFLKNVKMSFANGPGHRYSEVFTDRDVLYVNVPDDPAHPNFPAETEYKSNGDVGFAYKPTGDPYGNYRSEYLISKAYEDEIGRPVKDLYKDEHNNLPDGNSFWGTIYGIKKVGTNEAYRMRWHIENIDPGGNYYVIVIERFSATAKDRLSYHREDENYYRNYDWSRPTAFLRIPIVGLIGDQAWSSGKLGNFGTETSFLTSEKGQERKTYKVYRIKVHGDGRKNQFLCPMEDRKGVGGQIRLVRESTYQPDRNR